MKGVNHLNVGMTDLPAGPELDRMIAEKVMGWSLYYYDKGGPSSAYYSIMDHNYDVITFSDRPGRYASEFDTEESAWGNFKPSTNVAHAMDAVERLCNGDCRWSFRLEKLGDGAYCAEFSGPNYQGVADTPSLAICRAALLLAHGAGEK